jgi:hypothetical protein
VSWKYIRRGRDNFYTFVRLEVGDGYNVQFWHYLWCGDRPLKLFYPILFSIARFKDAWVVDNLSMLDGVAHWNVVFTRLAQDWEVKMVLSLHVRLYSHRIRHGAVDRLVWNLSKWGHFKVKSFYKALASPEIVFFP